MPNPPRAALHLKLDEVDMIAYAGETEPVCSFYYDDTEDSDRVVERARSIVHRSNIHHELLKALESAETAIEEATAIILYQRCDDVTFLEESDIGRAYLSLIATAGKVKQAIARGKLQQNAVDGVPGGAHV
jgi:hypothetical protein